PSPQPAHASDRVPVHRPGPADSELHGHSKPDLLAMVDRCRGEPVTSMGVDARPSVTAGRNYLFPPVAAGFFVAGRPDGADTTAHHRRIRSSRLDPPIPSSTRAVRRTVWLEPPGPPVRGQAHHAASHEHLRF